MESKQLIIAVSREFGSGGHCIAEELARRFALPLYDRNILEEIADEKNVDSRNLEKYDELPKNHLFSRTVRGFSNSPEEQIANMQFDFLRKKAEEGASFVIVGRCAETILKGNPGLITIFVLGDMDAKIKSIVPLHLISRVESERMIWRHDRKRKAYHNHYCEMKWGDSRNYDLCINSNKLGIERTTDTLEQYIRERMK